MKVHTQKHFELTAEDVQALILAHLELTYCVAPGTANITFNITPEQDNTLEHGDYTPAKFNGASVVTKSGS